MSNILHIYADSKSIYADDELKHVSVCRDAPTFSSVSFRCTTSIIEY